MYTCKYFLHMDTISKVVFITKTPTRLIKTFRKLPIAKLRSWNCMLVHGKSNSMWVWIKWIVTKVPCLCIYWFQQCSQGNGKVYSVKSSEKSSMSGEIISTTIPKNPFILCLYILFQYFTQNYTNDLKMVRTNCSAFDDIFRKSESL